MRQGQRRAVFVGAAYSLTAALLLHASLAAAQEAPAADDVQPLEVQSYQQDLGVSSEIAQQRLELQHDNAGIVEELKIVQSEDYAGVWFDNDSGEFVVPTVKGADESRLQKALSDERIVTRTRIEPVTYNWSALEDAQRQVDKALQGSFNQGLIRTSIDPRANAVVIDFASRSSEAQQAEIRKVTEEAGDRVEMRPIDAESLEARNTSCQFEFKRCSRPLRGGVGIKKGGLYGPECTAGFKAIGNTYGNRFMLTAGHCVVMGSVYKWYGEVPNLIEAPAIGLAEGTNYPGGDWTAINANGSYWDKSPWPSQVAFWEHGEAAQETPIEAESASYVGEYVCHSGLSTGGRCGSVVKMNVTAKVEAGLEYHLAMFGPTCAEEGDSGGPVFAGHVALGILSAKVLPAHGCGSDYGLYMEITEVDDALAVTVGPRLGTVPYTETEEATSVQSTSAVLTGYVNPHGITSNYSFEYGPTTVYGSTTQAWGAGSGWQTVPVSGAWAFEPVMTYHYRIRAQNNAGTSYGVDEEFTTPPAPPIVATEGVSGIAAGKATLNGTSNPRGSATSYRFEWGTSTEYGNLVPVPDAGIGAGRSNVPLAQAIDVKGLTTYHYRVVASNVAGTTYGTDRQFTTPDWRPVVTAENPSSLSGAQATLNGSVNPKGFATKYHFEYGTTPSYGTSVPSPDQEIGSGESAVKVSQALGGLQTATLYHVRLLATNSEGTTAVKATFETLTPSTLCKVIGPGCSQAQRYPSGTSIQSKLKSGKFKLESSLFTEECSESTLSGKSNAETGLPLPIEVTSLTAGGCSSPCKASEARNLPYSANLESGKGMLSVGAGGKGKPAIKLESCSFGGSCTFGATEVGLTFEGGSTATLIANGAALKLEEGSASLCGQDAKLTASYEVTSPKPLYAGNTSETVLCKAFTSPCSGPDLYSEGVKLEAKLQGLLSVTFGSYGAVPCSGATMEATLNAGIGNPIATEIQSLNLTGCTPCTSVLVKSLPFPGLLRATAGGYGRLVTNMLIEWSGCPLGVRCVFSSNEMPLEVNGGSPPSIKAIEAKINLYEGSTSFCGTFARMNALFSVTAPSALWVARGKI